MCSPPFGLRHQVSAVVDLWRFLRCQGALGEGQSGWQGPRCAEGRHSLPGWPCLVTRPLPDSLGSSSRQRLWRGHRFQPHLPLPTPRSSYTPEGAALQARGHLEVPRGWGLWTDARGALLGATRSVQGTIPCAPRVLCSPQPPQACFPQAGALDPQLFLRPMISPQGHQAARWQGGLSPRGSVLSPGISPTCPRDDRWAKPPEGPAWKEEVRAETDSV